MGRIKVLDDRLINRIAAGEVIERPASVLKELVENSLDADARSIDVQLLAGGRRRIRVVDDGVGMDRDDALLAVERHATSKLSRSDDLESIGTLGFRGEALASIAAVSRFTLRTATEDGAGTEVVVHGGRIQSVREAGVPRGTSIDVERLFLNVPARRKFLKTEATELSHAVRWLTRYALVRPQVRFRLVHGERRLLSTPPAADRRERIAQIFGRELAERLTPFHQESKGQVVSGFAGRPTETLPRREGQHLFVNGRAVQDRVLGHAVSEAYGDTMPRGRYAAVFLFVELEPGLVDVNVHPRKTEVRFRRSSEVHDRVRDAIRGALSGGEVIPNLGDLRPSQEAASSYGVAAATVRFLEAREAAGVSPEYRAATSARQPAGPYARPLGTAVSQLAEPRGKSGSIASGEATHPELPVDEPPAVALGQFRDSYIVAQDAKGLILIDQHAAHERVIYERYLAAATVDEVEVQRLLFPVTVDLAPHEKVLMDEEIGEFRRLGFVVEPFGGNTFRIDAVPAVVGELDPISLLRELLGEAAQARSAAADVAGLRRKLVTSAACQAAIKINHPLQPPAMQALLEDLLRVENPSTCPHGRPALFRLTTDEIERAFRRR